MAGYWQTRREELGKGREYLIWRAGVKIRIL
jgi:hypothetical protein